MFLPLTKYLTAGFISYSLCVDFFIETKLNRMKKLDRSVMEKSSYNYSTFLSSVSKNSIVERIEDRKEWNKLCNTQGIEPKFNPGTYTFVYRNYVNFEEKWAMVSARSPLHSLLWETKSPTQMIIHSNNTVVLKDEFRIVGIPLHATWYGVHTSDTIYWNSSDIKTKIIDFKKPEATERQRTHPWHLFCSDPFVILMRKNTSKNEILVFVNSSEI